MQDLAAPPHICMDRIADLKNYPKMVPKGERVLATSQNVCMSSNPCRTFHLLTVRKVDVYEEETFVNVRRAYIIVG